MSDKASNKLNASPLYLQIVESLARDIRAQILPPGARLPTVSEYTQQTGASRGTIIHAYDTLEKMGLIQKTQGRGTFVSIHAPNAKSGKKGQAMAAIDRMLAELRDLGFSSHQIRIFVELKMRFHEESQPTVQVGAVDCCPETLAAMRDALSVNPDAEVSGYLLSSVLQNPGTFDPGHDLYVTTFTHCEDLASKLPAASNVIRIVMAISADTLLELAKIPPEASVGILSTSARFSDIILNACTKYCTLVQPPQFIPMDSLVDARDVLAKLDVLILPQNYHALTTHDVQVALHDFAKSKTLIPYQYQPERSSMLYFEEQVYKLVESKHQHLPE